MRAVTSVRPASSCRGQASSIAAVHAQHGEGGGSLLGGPFLCQAPPDAVRHGGPVQFAFRADEPQLHGRQVGLDKVGGTESSAAKANRRFLSNNPPDASVMTGKSS